MNIEVSTKPDVITVSRTAPDLFADVGAFHEKFGLLRHGVVVPGLLNQEDFEFRLKFLEEELKELVFHRDCGEMPETIDALVDLVYVALGTAHMMGFDFNRHWALVHEKNMQKERAASAGDPRSIRKNKLDVVKPEGWTPPNHQPIIFETFATCDAAGIPARTDCL